MYTGSRNLEDAFRVPQAFFLTKAKVHTQHAAHLTHIYYLLVLFSSYLPVAASILCAILFCCSPWKKSGGLLPYIQMGYFRAALCVGTDGYRTLRRHWVSRGKNHRGGSLKIWHGWVWGMAWETPGNQPRFHAGYGSGVISSLSGFIQSSVAVAVR